MAEVVWQARRVSDGVLVDVTGDTAGTPAGAPTPNALEGGGGGAITVTGTEGGEVASATGLLVPGTVVESSAGVAVVTPIIISDVEPDADTLPTGTFWLRILTGVNTKQLYVLSDADAWEACSAGPGSSGDFEDLAERTVGLFTEYPGASTYIGLRVTRAAANSGNSTVVYQSEDGNITAEAKVSSGDAYLYYENATGGGSFDLSEAGPSVSQFGSTPFTVNPAKVMMPNLPTANPNVAGQLWNDTGTLKVSAG